LRYLHLHYDSFFDSKPVRAFCDLMGIEVATHEGARHRCPYLINLLDACGIVTQSQTVVTTEKLALSPAMLVMDERSYDVGQRRLAAIVADWPRARLPAGDLAELRELFGDDFLTEHYRLQELVEIPNG
jgi:hypothetical protein